MSNNPSPGTEFRDLMVTYIKSWNAPIDVLQEINVGSRFRTTPRKLDIVLHNRENDRFMGIECKVQVSGGTADEKLIYAIDDCKTCPIPTLIVFGGSEIKDDIKALLIHSGVGLEVKLETRSIDVEANGKISNKVSVVSITDENALVRQRCYIELGMNWLPIATGDKVPEQLAELGIARISDVHIVTVRAKNCKDSNPQNQSKNKKR